jgi:hypothetical protein
VVITAKWIVSAIILSTEYRKRFAFNAFNIRRPTEAPRRPRSRCRERAWRVSVPARSKWRVPPEFFLAWRARFLIEFREPDVFTWWAAFPCRPWTISSERSKLSEKKTENKEPFSCALAIQTVCRVTFSVGHKNNHWIHVPGLLLRDGGCVKSS